MMERESRTRLVTAVVLAAVFGSGVLLGLVADSNFGAAPADGLTEATETEGEGSEPRQRRWLYDQVDPTTVQYALIDSIVVKHRARTNALDEELRAEYRSGFRTILLATRDEIKGVFTPEQASEYQRRLDEWDARPASERRHRDDQE